MCVCVFFFWWGEKAEVTVAVLSETFLFTWKVWIVQAHKFSEIHPSKYYLLYSI